MMLVESRCSMKGEGVLRNASISLLDSMQVGRSTTSNSKHRGLGNPPLEDDRSWRARELASATAYG